MSKGSTRRPREVPREEYERRWEETFGEKPPTLREIDYIAHRYGLANKEGVWVK